MSILPSLRRAAPAASRTPLVAAPAQPSPAQARTEAFDADAAIARNTGPQKFFPAAQDGRPAGSTAQRQSRPQPRYIPNDAAPAGPLRGPQSRPQPGRQTSQQRALPGNPRRGPDHLSRAVRAEVLNPRVISRPEAFRYDIGRLKVFASVAAGRGACGLDEMPAQHSEFQFDDWHAWALDRIAADCEAARALVFDPAVRPEPEPEPAREPWSGPRHAGKSRDPEPAEEAAETAAEGTGDAAGGAE